jgi:3-hydroxyisobutyrate dehydrogenase-like beta-hydroxyacid dehydrogenase
MGNTDASVPPQSITSASPYEMVRNASPMAWALVAQADIVFLCLPGTDAVRETLFGVQGIAPLMGKGQIVVDTSTMDYLETRDFAIRLAERGIGFIDAPVSGMEARAIEGTLTAMCGGKAETLEKVRPYLSCVANNILHMGDSGSGQLSKLINQLLFDINCAAIAEVLPMAAKLGIDPEKIGKIINSGTGRSYASEFFIPRILKNNFSDGYPLQHAYKDIDAGAKVSATHNIPMPVLAAASATYQMALLKGHGHLDKGAMIRVFEDLLGVQFRSGGGDGKD